MQTQWQKIFVKITFWLIVEIVLNLLGLDNLADYSEFVFEGKTLTVKSYICEVAISSPPERNLL
ncbi:MAG: hypothetical protein AB1589_32365 [Cyanobacteriota bacterium]